MRTIKGKRILVTGGAGFIGSHLVDTLLHGRQMLIHCPKMWTPNKKCKISLYIRKHMCYHRHIEQIYGFVAVFVTVSIRQLADERKDG